MADKLYAADLGYSTLDGAIDDAVVTLTVDSAASFPGSTEVPFLIGIGTEIIKVGAVNTGTGAMSTLTRGYAGTAAAAHLDGATVSCKVFAEYLNNAYDLIDTKSATIHNLVDTTNHPVTGLTAGHVLTASGATTYGFALPQMYEIATTTLTEAAASITFSTIPATYKHLRILGNVRSSRDHHVDILYVRFNGDTGTNYHLSVIGIYGNGTADSSATYGATAGILGLISTNRTESPANSFSAVTVDIPNYANTAFHTQAHSRTMALTHTQVDDLYQHQPSNYWVNTAAITTILLYATNDLMIGTTVTLYGIK